eukprot:SAG31_NODE_8715_length_1400_cov_1.374327_1_plen_153_part_00
MRTESKDAEGTERAEVGRAATQVQRPRVRTAAQVKSIRRGQARQRSGEKTAEANKRWSVTFTPAEVLIFDETPVYTSLQQGRGVREVGYLVVGNTRVDGEGEVGERGAVLSPSHSAQQWCGSVLLAAVVRLRPPRSSGVAMSSSHSGAALSS